MKEMLQELVNSRGVPMRVEREKGVIRGVKILGTQSRNGRTYLPQALTQAVELYEGAKVNVNHPTGHPTGPRDYRDRIGVVRNVEVRPGDGLFADFHFNPKHALSEQLIWDAENAPENVGFSHNVQARTKRQGERTVVEAITRVESVDLVADPATTRGLFESAAPTGKGTSAPLSDLTVDDLRRHRADLIEAIEVEWADEITRLRTEVDRLELAEAVHQRRALVRRLLSEFKLPDPELAEASDRTLVGERFFQSLLSTPSDATVRELIEERAQLIENLSTDASMSASRSGHPLSRDQNPIHESSPTDAKSFAATIR